MQRGAGPARTLDAQHWLDSASPSLSPRTELHSSTSFESIAVSFANAQPATLDRSPFYSLNASEPVALHLTPCSLEQYLQLGHNNEDRYELVDGLLTSLPFMSESEAEHGLIVNALFSLFTVLSDEIADPVRPYSQMAYLLRARRKGGASRDTVRLPDLYLVRKSEVSYSSDVPDSPFQGERHPQWKKARMIVEVTSTNRDTDLIPKREEYRQDKILEYVIIDRQKGVPNPRPCVEVHTLDRRGSYKKKVYHKDQQVDCSYFSHWNLTADEMLDYKALRRIFEKEKKRLYQLCKVAEQQTSRADRAELERERAELERERAGQARERAGQARERAEQARERAEQARERAERAEQARERAEQARERAEQETDHLIAYATGRRKTPPRSLRLDSSQLRSEGSSALPILPKSPASPPRTVRKTAHFDVKKTSRKGGNQTKHK